MAKVHGDIRCFICDAAVTEEGLLHISKFKDHEGKKVLYGRCSLCFCFHKVVVNGSDPAHPRIGIYSSLI